MKTPVNANTRLAMNLVAVVVGMVLLAYASVPLYRLFCQVTGYGGTTEQGKAAPGPVYNRKMTITFNADISPELTWKFRPGQEKLRVKVGQQSLTYFVAENTSDEVLTGRATYNVVPFKAGPYFVKIECFCFSNQTLQPHQKVHMPVSFYIDPSVMDDRELDDVHTITLSYTFFPVKKDGK